MIRSIHREVADRVLDSVVEVFGFDRLTLLARRRPKRVVEARQVAYLILREAGFLSFPQIAEIMGHRDHATVIHGCSSVVLKARASSVLREKIDQVRLLSLVRSQACEEFVGAYVDGRPVEFLEDDRGAADCCARIGCGWMRGLHPAALATAPRREPQKRAA